MVGKEEKNIFIILLNREEPKNSTAPPGWLNRLEITGGSLSRTQKPAGSRWSQTSIYLEGRLYLMATVMLTEEL